MSWRNTSKIGRARRKRCFHLIRSGRLKAFAITCSRAGSSSEMAGGRVFRYRHRSRSVAALPGLDLIRAQDVAEIAGRDDGKLLAWATENERVAVTYDLGHARSGNHGSSASAST